MLSLTPEQSLLVEENIRLVHLVARHYNHISKPTYEDLVTRLYVRLCISIANFNPDAGYELSSFVVKSLQGELKNFFRDEVWVIKPPRETRRQAFSSIVNPDSEGQDLEMVRSCVFPCSLDTRTLQTDALEGSRPIRDMPNALVNDPEIERDVTDRFGGKEILREVFAALTLPERTILALRMKGKSIREIQLRFGVPSRIVSKAWHDIQLRTTKLYAAALNGLPLRASPGSGVLERALRKKKLQLENAEKEAQIE